MNTYYYNDGFREFGPFTAQDLLNKKIRPDYRLRLNGTEEWVLAKEVDEVARLFKAQQPQASSATSSTYQPLNEHRIDPQGVDRDSSFEQQAFDNKGYSTTDTTSTPTSWREKLLLAILCFWLFETVTNWLMSAAGIETWTGPGKVVRVFLNMIFAAIPILLALIIKKESLRIIAIIIAALITFSVIINNIKWYFI